jgi:AraC-like DNA-binding protein/quercetin dioxygenase-like cupin family protein
MKIIDIIEASSSKVNIISFNSGKTWSAHNVSHPFHAFYYIFKGSAYLQTRTDIYTLKKGHVCILPSNIQYSHKKTDTSEDFKFLWFNFICNPDFNNEFISILVKENTELWHFIQILILFTQVRKTSQRKLNNIIKELLNSVSEVEELFFSYNEKALKVKNFVDKHFKKAITLNDLADMCGITPQYLCNIFHEFMNVSPMQYLQNVRLEHAVHYLGKDLKINEITDFTGFRDESNFFKAFKKNIIQRHIYLEIICFINKYNFFA